MAQLENELGHAPIEWNQVYRFGASQEHREPTEPEEFANHYTELRRLAVEARAGSMVFDQSVAGTGLVFIHKFLSNRSMW